MSTTGALAGRSPFEIFVAGFSGRESSSLVSEFPLSTSLSLMYSALRLAGCEAFLVAILDVVGFLFLASLGMVLREGMPSRCAIVVWVISKFEDQELFSRYFGETSAPLNASTSWAWSSLPASSNQASVHHIANS